MNNQILSCCNNSPSFRIIYLTGETLLVCKDCYDTKSCWSRHIKEKIDYDQPSRSTQKGVFVHE